MWCINTLEYYSAMKEKEILPFAATWMKLDIIILNELSQKEKDKYYIISLTYGIWKMTQMNPSVRQKQTQRHRKEASPGCQRGRRMREGTDWEFGVRNGNSFQCSCLENPRDGGAWWAAVYGVAQSRTRLKRLSSSSSSSRTYFGLFLHYCLGTYPFPLRSWFFEKKIFILWICILQLESFWMYLLWFHFLVNSPLWGF